MAENIDFHIKHIQSKLQLLLKKHALVIKENEQLQKENAEIKSKVKTLLEKNEQIEIQVNILKTSTGKLEGIEKSDFEKSINSYIRTIDKCISILNK
jgi:regulator of replication initiation timing